MAKLKRKYYADLIDLELPSILAIDMEENGVVYHYNLREKKCSVSKIEEGVENVVIADEIRVDGVGVCPVVRWGIPLIDKECVRNVKSIELGKNLTEFNELTTSGLVNLEKLVIPNTFEKFPPFGECFNLKEITLPDKLTVNWECFCWSHRMLQKIILLHEGTCREIGDKEISSMRYSYQKKVDKEKFDRNTEKNKIEKEKRHQEAISYFTDRYIVIVCAVPYIWALVNGFRKIVNFDLGIVSIILQLMMVCLLAFGLLVGLFIAVMSAFYLTNHSRRKILTALVAPILAVPFSWIVLSVAISVLTLFESCSTGFYGIIDPRFL